MQEVKKFEVDLELLKKYSRPGPRYTSYPTAPHFHSEFTPEDFYREIVASNEKEDAPDLSLYFHFPFCRTLCYFCGCNVVITHNPNRIERYLSYLKKEIDMISRLIRPDRKVVQLHWGGGTPTYLTPQQIRDIYGYITGHFNFSDDAEISIEIDPRTITPEHLPTLREIGFNRVSFGVQDFHQEVQEVINRIQTDEHNRFVISESRRLGFDSVNIDLIYGLPYQTVESYQETIDKVLELSPDRLAVFNYAHVPWLKKHQRLLPEDAMPSPTERLAILKLVIERLTEAGYVYIGMDHFAKPDDELALALQDKTLYRNFQGYSTRAGADVYAMGVTAISQLTNVYAQNVKHTKEYEEMLDAGRLPTHVGYKLTEDDHIRRYVITEIMCNSRILKADVKERYGVDFDSYFADVYDKLSPFVEDGLVSFHPEGIVVHEAGRLVIRNIAMAFDAYLEQDEKQGQPIYSRTV
ncbi:MAG: oxygen-independent coproporphyrinogen III oxidase [Methanobacteriota archaeon]|nr:MAG: oxygen-independent coproporphyrinogen III oxidase [Euryarchaeota archaeon]